MAGGPVDSREDWFAPQPLNEWVKKVEIDSGKRAGIPTDMAEKMKALERVDRFNNRRLLEPIGNIPPAEAEANFYAAMETETWPRTNPNQTPTHPARFSPLTGGRSCSSKIA